MSNCNKNSRMYWIFLGEVDSQSLTLQILIFHEGHSQNPQKINVWAGILVKHVVIQMLKQQFN